MMNDYPELTKTEHCVYVTLLQRDGVVSPSELVAACWGQEGRAANFHQDAITCYAHIANLRKKLPPEEAKPIITVHGRGYMLGR